MHFLGCVSALPVIRWPLFHTVLSSPFEQGSELGAGVGRWKKVLGGIQSAVTGSLMGGL